MARKNLMDGLMNAPLAQAPAPTARVDVEKPRYTGGAIGAVSQSIAALKSRSVSDIDTGLIDAGGLADRIDTDDPDHAALLASIRDHGQQVPILVRPHPEAEGRFQIVYGRRRVAALRALGQPARALVRDLDDRQLVLAQGQENSARKDLTFIEKVNFAAQMRDADYDRKAICDALSVDKTVISRMLSVADRVPTEMIELIGAAPGVGRDRWGDLAARIEAGKITLPAAAAMIAALPAGTDSDARFEAVLRADAPKPRAKSQTDTIAGYEGQPIARLTRGTGGAALALPPGDDGFSEWLAGELPDLHRRWRKSRRD
ncbi:plasmid partitioning protein RepB [Roseovarius dicentrarchi]|uniref:plasmid partitioning protein RepB n=1 Tax=Roseovarius dicentrarchi TaxID=2250573 RepID=UPI000DE87D80|nr:plasmid partitioning protein RepB [Roseovarius dicentrarchi]